MSNVFKDFYSPFKDETTFRIDPSLSREENYEGFKSASVRYSKLFGKDVELALVREALGIFGNETKYQDYRQNYVKYKLDGFLEGAVENNYLFRSKYNTLLKTAIKAGISEAEVKALLELLNIKIISNPKTTSKTAKEEKVVDDNNNQSKTIDQGKTTSKSGPDIKIGKTGKKSWKGGLLLGLVVIIMIGIVLYKYIPVFNKQNQTSFNKSNGSDKTTIDLAQASDFLDIQPPEYSKIEEAVKAFKANISEPGAKDGLIKAIDIYLKWGDDSPNLEESKNMYQKALECNSVANGSRTQEIKNKLDELSQK
jgi:hypothetical protein